MSAVTAALFNTQLPTFELQSARLRARQFGSALAFGLLFAGPLAGAAILMRLFSWDDARRARRGQVHTPTSRHFQRPSA